MPAVLIGRRESCCCVTEVPRPSFNAAVSRSFSLPHRPLQPAISFQRLGLGSDGRRPVGVLRFRPVQCGLRLVDGLLAALAFLSPSGLFLRLFAPRLFRSRS